MSDKPKLRSLNEGIAAELNLVELEEKLELSPVGILDLLVSSASFGDNTFASDCNDYCRSQGNCDKCGTHCHINVPPDPNPDCLRNECTILGDLPGGES